MTSSIPNQMKALRVNESGQKYYTLEDVPVPKPTGYQALLKIHAAGMCHTDLLVMGDSDIAKSMVNYPLTGSHEPAGEIVQLGEDAKKHGKVKVGDRVAGCFHMNQCFECADCKLVDWKFCPTETWGGIKSDGFFAEYAIVDARFCAKLPDKMPYVQAAPLTCAGVTIYGAIKRANLKPGQIIGISGLGALGHLGVQMAKAIGLKVVGIDARPQPLDSALKSHLPPDLAINALETSIEDAQKQVAKLRPDDYFGWPGVDAMILTADPISSHRYGLDLTRRHGLIVIVAQPDKFEFTFNDFIFRDLTMVGHLHGNDRDLQETVDLVAEKGVSVDVNEFRVEDHEKMVDSLGDDSRKGKSVLVF